MPRMGTVALGLLLLWDTASADWTKLLGKEAPDPTTTWLRACDGTNFDCLLGKALVVVFWSPEGDRAADDLFLVNELHERIYRRGGRVLALTSAPAESAKALCEAEDVLCPVGAATEHAAFGSGPLPYAYLVAPDRKVAWQGPFAALPPSVLDQVLKRTRPFGLIPLSDENKECAEAYKKGRLIEASCWVLDRAARSKKEAARLPAMRPFAELFEAEAKYLHSMVELNRAYWWDMVEEGRKREDYDRMLYGLDLIQRHLAGHEYRAEELGVKLGDHNRAEAEAEKLDTPEVKRSLEASKALAAIVAAPVPANLTQAAKDNRLRALEEFQKAWEGTWAAKRAARRAQWLSGLPTRG